MFNPDPEKLKAVHDSAKRFHKWLDTTISNMDVLSAMFYYLPGLKFQRDDRAIMKFFSDKVKQDNYKHLFLYDRHADFNYFNDNPDEHKEVDMFDRFMFSGEGYSPEIHDTLFYLSGIVLVSCSNGWNNDYYLINEDIKSMEKSLKKFKSKDQKLFQKLASEFYDFLVDYNEKYYKGERWGFPPMKPELPMPTYS